ncbi:MAG TPA: hypothetical protein VFI39_10990 [Gemmatimonadales bacterium]|nr:hypothetical protein [Gemmatimonadales bacterium]
MAQSFPSFSDDPADWFRRHQQRVTQIGIAVVAAGAVVWFGWSWQARKTAAANAALDLARSTAEANNLSAAAGQFQQIIERYKGTDAAGEAVIALNQVRMINGQFALAAVNLQSFLATGPKARFGVPANGLLGAALESAGRAADAGAAYAEASRLADLPYLKADYLLQAGKAYILAGKSDLASAALDTVIVKYKDTPVYTEAVIRLAELTKGAEPKGSDAVARLPQTTY